MKIDILGIKIDKIDQAEALKQIEQWIQDPGKHVVVTPNPEMILSAQKDPEFKKILNTADLAIPDSSSLGFSHWFLKRKFWERLVLWPLFFLPLKQLIPIKSGLIPFDRVSGTDLTANLCKLSAEKGFAVGFLGGGKEVAEKCAERLQKKYPKLRVGFAESGGEVNIDGQLGVLSARFPVVHPRSLTLVAATRRESLLAATPRAIPPVDILFVAFGHIKQEKWITGNLNKIPVKVAIGVGGAFDYLSGSVPRAPEIIRNLGFEWLFRLIIQPWRFKRQLALFKYLWLLTFKG